MTRKFYDAIYADNLPPDGDGYLGYDDGNWPDAAAVAAKFPGKPVALITVNPGDDKGVIGDGPPDNGRWPQWVAWVQMRRSAGVDPTVNTNASSWAPARAAFQAANVAEPHWWIAAYDGDPAIPAGAVAKQYASNGTYDTSSVADYWPGVDPAPVIAPPVPPQPQPVIPEEDPVQIEPLSVHPGEYALVVPSGVDTLALVADGYSGDPASVRLAIWVGNGVTVLDSVAVGGSSGVHTFGHPLPAGCTGVTVRRLDAEAYPVAIGFRAS